MTNSWDQIEKQNRRERLRKRWRIFGGITMLLFFTFMYGVPRIIGHDENEQADNSNSTVKPAESIIGANEPQASQPVEDLPLQPEGPEAAELATKSSSEIVSPVESEVVDEPQLEIVSPPAVRSSSVFETPKPDPELLSTAEGLEVKESSETASPDEAEVMNEPQAAIVAAPAVRSSSVFDTLPPDPELVRTAETMKAKLKSQIEKLDGDSNRLENYGGDKWKQIQTLAESALSTDDLTIAVEETERAIDQLEAMEVDLDYAEFREQVRGQDPRELLAAVVKFRASHSEHPRLNEVDQVLTPLSREKWLTLASKELKEASPDDSGFSEGWLPIASAWQLVGNEAEAREAVRQAIEVLPRMTKPERVVESILEICQHELFDRASAKQLIEDAAEMCEQVASGQTRSHHFANLSGLAKKLGQGSQASELLGRSLALVDKTGLGSVSQKYTLTQEARAASWTESPETIFTICAKIEKLNYPKPLVNANAYGHAAISAARRGDRTQFFKAMLLTENALAPVSIYDYPNYAYTARLAEANILQRRWRAAVIVANNMPDPYFRASILFRVMKNAPQEIRVKNFPELFERFAEQRWATPACAAHTEHRVRSGDSLLSVAEWSTSLPLASLRAAAFAGIARSVGTTTVADDSHDEVPIVVPVDINDIDSLMNEAEQVAHQIQEPTKAAFVWLQIARTWNLLGKTQRYKQAVANLDDNVFDTWTDIWEQRPPVKQSYNGGYIDTSKRHRSDEERTVEKIIDCHRYLAAMQADLGDSDGAMESCLNLANAAGFLNSKATFDEQNFLFIKALLNRLHGDTKVGPDAILLVKYRSYGYNRSLLAAWAKDLPGLQAALPDLVENSRRRGSSAKERAQAVRGYGELAILHAERGNLASYRDARRSAQSLIDRGQAGSEMKLVLATADALAGEFALAESNLIRGTLGWYGDANRPRKQLAISLAAKGQWEKALEHAQGVSLSQAFYRVEAWTAVAEARRNDESESQKQILEWATSLEQQVDKSAAFCGLALAAAGR